MSKATGFQAFFSPNHREKRRARSDVLDFVGEDAMPVPKYRHAAPSAPWPWMDFAEDNAEVPPVSERARYTWTEYPQSHFGNWTKDQVDRCRMLKITQDKCECKIHTVDVLADGKFVKPDGIPCPREIELGNAAEQYWEELQKPLDSKLRVRAIFVENITDNVLKILGAKYNIEPFFFSSSANWIPSRYQEDAKDKEGDHITVILPFIQFSSGMKERNRLTPSYWKTHSPTEVPTPRIDRKQTINIQVPLVLPDEKTLLPDLLAIHMIRSTKDNVIISYHHHSRRQGTTAARLRSLVQRTGDSVYWQKIYAKSKDPTFLFLAILWCVLYAWDEALEEFYKYLSCYLDAANVGRPITHTRKLHILQAHLLYYERLLRDFKRSVEFVRDTPNPAMDSEEDREPSKTLLRHESDVLLSEVQRLEEHTKLLSAQLQNTMKLVVDEASMRDSTSMRQITYLTTLFLPASYLVGVFGTHVAGINVTLAKYIVSTIVLTMVTGWAVVALDERSPLHLGDRTIARRAAWPVLYGCGWMQNMVKGTPPDASDQV